MVGFACMTRGCLNRDGDLDFVTKGRDNKSPCFIHGEFVGLFVLLFLAFAELYSVLMLHACVMYMWGPRST